MNNEDDRREFIVAVIVTAATIGIMAIGIFVTWAVVRMVF